MFKFLSKIINNGSHKETEVIEKELVEARKEHKKAKKDLKQSVEVRKASMETLSQTINLKVLELECEEGECDDETKIINIVPE